MTDDLVVRLKECQRIGHTQWSDYQRAIDALESRAAALREKDEQIAELTGGAGWLAQMVIDKLGGTNDLPAWVRQSATYYAEALALAAAAEARLVSTVLREPDDAIQPDAAATT